MGFKYVEPTLEELNRRISGGMTFVQSDLSGEYTEKYYAPTGMEVALSQAQPSISWDQAQAAAKVNTVAAAVAAHDQQAYKHDPPPILTPPASGTPAGTQLPTTTEAKIPTWAAALFGSRMKARPKARRKIVRRRKVTRRRRYY